MTLPLAITSIIFIFLSACSNVEKKDTRASSSSKIAQCVFPQSTTPAPVWVCSHKYRHVEIASVGVAQKIKSKSAMNSMASLNARESLTIKLRIKIAKMVQIYALKTNKGDIKSMWLLANSVAGNITSSNLVGVKVFKTRTDPTGRVFVLLGLTRSNMLKLVDSAVKSSFTDNKAMWNMFTLKRDLLEITKLIRDEI